MDEVWTARVKEPAMDRLYAMNLCSALKEQVGISIPEEAAGAIQDVRGTVAGVQQILAKKSGAPN
jgi:acyl carrier protein